MNNNTNLFICIAPFKIEKSVLQRGKNEKVHISLHESKKKIERKILRTFKFFKREEKKRKGKKKIEIKPSV